MNLEGSPIPPDARPLVELADPTPRQLCALALKQGAGIDVIERFSALAERWEATEAKKAWARAIAGFKEECPPVVKKNVVKDRSGNQIYKFASYDDIKAVTVPYERKYGIVTGFTFDNTTPTSLRGVLKITVGSHTEEFIGAVPVPTQGAGGINATQLMGQAHTYLKRYLYLAAFDLIVAGEDSDAIGLIEKVTPDQIGQINDAIDVCRKAGQWDEEGSLRNMLRAYEIDYLGDLPADRVTDLLADLDRQARKGKGVKK